jgi:molybdopterin-guanine dinucleotide biosynthesis protein A
VAGVRLVDRVVAAVQSVTKEVVLIANDPAAYESVALPVRRDTIAGAGALGGLFTALLWAAERERAGVLAVACDLAFPSAPLLGDLARMGEVGDLDVVLPESTGPRGVEPLFAYYSVTCLPEMEDAIARGDLELVGFSRALRVHHVPLDQVRRHGDPRRLFFNVNTREDRDVAERLATMTLSAGEAS